MQRKTNVGTNAIAYTVALNKSRINDVNTEIPFIHIFFRAQRDIVIENAIENSSINSVLSNRRPMCIANLNNHLFLYQE